MTITDGTPGGTVTITDGGGNDQSSKAGEVGYTGLVGSWFLDLNMVGQTKPLIGSTLAPSLDLQFVAATETTGGTLRIIFSDDYFGPIGGTATTSIAGTTAGSVAAAAYYNQDNAIGGEGSRIGSPMGPLSGPSFGTAQDASVVLSYPYSLTLEVDITHPDGPSAPSGKLRTSGNLALDLTPVERTPVPDGGVTMAMFGLGFACVEGLRRRLGRS